jgi:hypothetical protein
VSAAEAKRKERRSETIDEAPSFGEALASGDVGAEHVDALAAATSKLNDDVKAALLDHEDDLLAEASRTTPEQFGRSCRELARRLERDNGIERNARQRRDTYLSRKLNGATGMIEGRFAFHPELANQVFGAVDREVAAMIKAGERRGDPAFVDRSVDRNQLAAEALGTLVSCGHRQVRPLEADITLIVDAKTVATGQLHDHSVCETIDGAAIPPASVRRLLCNGRVTPIIVDQHGNPLVMGRTIRHANRRQRRALRGDLPLLCVHRMRRRVRALRDPPHPSVGAWRPDRSDQLGPAVFSAPSRRTRRWLAARARHRSNAHDPTTRWPGVRRDQTRRTGAITGPIDEATTNCSVTRAAP